MLTAPAPARTGIPSKYQRDIYDFVQYGHYGQHGVVDAVPGSGKTTTLIGAAKHVEGDNNLFVAFNKNIATEISNRLQRENLSMKAGTIHSTGYAALRAKHPRWEVDDRKYRNIIRDLLPLRQRDSVAPLANALTLSRITRTPLHTTDDLDRLCSRYTIELEPNAKSVEPDLEHALYTIKQALEDGDDLARDRHIIDYADMICLPVEWDLSIPQHATVFVDECQDLNAAQLEFVLRCVAPNGRMLAVGDRHQSIYGFAGADTTSIPTIIQRVHASVLPLSICYRCPRSHVALAAELYPGIEPASWAIPGEIRDITENQLYSQAQVGDMLLCRTTKPLIAACLNFIRAGIPARVRGRDIGAQLTGIVRHATRYMTATDWHSFPAALIQYEAVAIEAKTRRGASDLELQSIRDRVLSVATVYEATYDRCHSVADLEREIVALFSDEQSGITLSTVHKAKGLEADHVYILHPELMPHPKARGGWEMEQERNIEYVALTRAKQSLSFVAMDAQ